MTAAIAFVAGFVVALLLVYQALEHHRIAFRLHARHVFVPQLDIKSQPGMLAELDFGTDGGVTIRFGHGSPPPSNPTR